LLIYDNAASPSVLDGLLPSAGARVLITSRFSDWAGLACELALNTLTPEEAVAFLQSRAGRDDAVMRDLIARCLPSTRANGYDQRSCY